MFKILKQAGLETKFLNIEWNPRKQMCLLYGNTHNSQMFKYDGLEQKYILDISGIERVNLGQYILFTFTSTFIIFVFNRKYMFK